MISKNRVCLVQQTGTEAKISYKRGKTRNVVHFEPMVTRKPFLYFENLCHREHRLEFDYKFKRASGQVGTRVGYR